MTSGEFLEQFGHFIEASNGIQKLREIILQLAVRGKLVPQYPSDAPVSVLLARIAADKEQLTAVRKQRTSKPARSRNPQPYPFSLPRGWAWVPFGEATICRDGERVPLSRVQRETRSGAFDYYGASGVIDKIDDYLFDKPLLLVGEDGANLINRSTPIAFIARGKYWVNNHAHVIDGVSEEYLQYLCLYVNAIDLKPFVTGTAQPKMNQAKMNSILVALPPEAEQARIVAKVDELMCLCDRLETERNAREETHQRLIRAVHHQLTEAADAAGTQTAWCRIRDNFSAVYSTQEGVQSLRQSIYMLAIAGKLVPQNPNEEPASAFLKRQRGAGAQLTKAARWQAADGDPASSNLPSGWAQVVLGELGTIKGGGTPSKQNPNYWDGDVPWVTPKDMKVGVIRNSIDHISESAILNSAVKLIRRNALLMVVRGMILAHSFPVAVAAVEVTINQDMKALEVLDDSIVPFVYLLLKGKRDIVLKAVERSSHGTCRLDSDSLFGMKFALPPLAEQHRIVARVDELMALCDQLEASIRAKDETAARYAEAVVQQIAAA